MCILPRILPPLLQTVPLVLVSCVTFDADRYEKTSGDDSPDGSEPVDEDLSEDKTSKDGSKETGGSESTSMPPDKENESPRASGGGFEPAAGGTSSEDSSSGGSPADDPSETGGGLPIDLDPTTDCPSLCNGGCDENVCKIICVENTCNEQTFDCPSDYSCELDCTNNACVKAELRCGGHECRIHCRKKSCKEFRFLCQNATCELECGAEEACKDATMSCSEGAICKAFVACDASSPSVSCDNSDCEVAECEDD